MKEKKSLTSQAEQQLIAKISFPLNVYAYLLAREPAGLRYLHYGWYESQDEEIARAQERSTSWLMERLPPPPARILEVGAGVGTTLAGLLSRGYRIIGITPDRPQISFMHARYGPDFPIKEARFEEWSATQAYDCLIFQESGQYIPLEQLFSRAAALLRPGGRLLLLDEVVLGEPEPGDTPHPLAELKEEATRQGFTLEEERDISSLVIPTLDFLLRATADHREALLTELSLSAAQLDTLDASNRRYRERYASGAYGYTALSFRLPQASSRWVAGPLPADDAGRMQHLFHEVFGHDLGRAMYQWKYGASGSRAYGVWNREGQLVAHYGGFSRTLMMFGQTVPAYQIGDVMVHPDERGVMTRRGAFFLAASGFFERYVGQGRAHRLAFGFPNARAMRVGKRLGLYAAVEKISLARWPAREGRGWTARHVLVPLWQRFDWREAAADLWQRMRETMRDVVLVCRDAEYLKYRYRERPEGNYQVYLLRSRFFGTPVAIVVVKQNDDRLDWLDFVGPRRALAPAVEALRRLAASRGLVEVTAWLTGRMLEDFPVATGTVEPTDIEIAQSDWRQSRGLAAKTTGHWWLMYGDTDFL